MAETTINFGEWLPDQPGIAGSVTDAVNCYPVANGYAPLNSESDLSNDAGANLLLTFAGKAAGVVSLFAGSSTNLYKFDSADLNLDPLTTAGYSSIEFWDVTQFGDKMIMANGSDKLQSYTLNSSTYAADLSADAPTAKYVTVVGDFVVAANTASNENKVYWSDINDETDWVPSSTSQSDTQIIPDGGDITGLAGGEFGLIFLERAIYRMTYAGSPFFFQFDAISRTLGCVSSGSIAQFGGFTYFLADDGFYVTEGQSFTNIGEEKINRWFFENASKNDLRVKMSSGVDPIRKLIVWCFMTQNGTFNLLIYSIPNKKWSYAQTTATSVAAILTPSVTLEGLDLYSASLDDLTISLDDPQWAGGNLLIAGTTGQKIVTFAGAAKAAQISTGDISIGRSVVNLARPLVDNGSGTAAVASRDNLAQVVSFGGESAPDSDNRCSLRSAGRYHRVRVTPTGNWKTAAGVIVDITKQGVR